MECVCPHALPVSEVLRCYKSDEHVGLSDEQVARGLAKYGPNGQYGILYRLLSNKSTL